MRLGGLYIWEDVQVCLEGCSGREGVAWCWVVTVFKADRRRRWKTEEQPNCDMFILYWHALVSAIQSDFLFQCSV